MKKLILTLALVTFVTCFSQKKITITNLTSAAMKIYGIRTKPTTGTYPYCYGYSFGLYSGQSYSLVNNLSTSKFPFYSSPTSLPPIISNLNWKRTNSATSSLNNQTGLSLWNSTIATTQNFSFIDFSIGIINGLPGSFGTFAIPTVNSTTIQNTAAGWEMLYDYYPPTAVNPIAEYVITFVDL
ncbi:hypothetical protein [Flavobacterium sp.]|uniref:hypothetical protein n=1 Tax=Flavobacterium sp. TaxID=239 RepID=UPI00375256F4